MGEESKLTDKKEEKKVDVAVEESNNVGPMKFVIENPIEKNVAISMPSTIEQSLAKDTEKELASTVIPEKNLKDDNEKFIIKPEKSIHNRESSSIKAPVLPYNEPSWGARPPDSLYSIEVIKNGCVKSRTVLEKKSFFVFGRLPSCDIVIDHPSSSRYHSILQYRGISDDKHPIGYYLWDLASTHGTFVNKKQIKSNTYVRIRTGFVLKFGGSTRLYIFQGPDEEQEEEGKIVKKKQIKLKEDLSSGDDENSSDGISWGMGEDAVEEEVDLQTILKRKKPLELKDPKKTLRGFFEREGLDLEYGVEEQGSGNTKVYVTRVSLPIDTPTGEEVFSEGRASNKKQSVLLCATDACRILDAYDMLRSVQHESETAKRVKQLADNDFYDSDDDSFTDRTGQVEKKRLSRMARFTRNNDEAVQTFESLNEKLKDLDHSLAQLKSVLAKSENAEKEDENKDSLDAFMSGLGAKIDKKVKFETKRKIAQHEKDRKDLMRLIDIARPASMPELIVRNPIEEKPLKSELSQKEEKRTIDSSDTTKIIDKSSKVECHDTINNLTDVDGPNSVADENLTAMDKDIIESNPTEVKKDAPSNPDFKVPIALPMSIKSNSDARKRKSSPANTERQPTTEDEAHKKKKKKKRSLGPSWKSPSDAKFAEWTPPQGQTGDGKTSLNEKFGY